MLYYHVSVSYILNSSLVKLYVVKSLDDEHSCRTPDVSLQIQMHRILILDIVYLMKYPEISGPCLAQISGDLDTVCYASSLDHLQLKEKYK